MRFNFLESLFAPPVTSARFSKDHHLTMAKAFVGKDGLYQAFCIGSPNKGGLYQKLQVLFVLEGDSRYWNYLKVYQGLLAGRAPTPELLLEVRRETFLAIWCSHNPLSLLAPWNNEAYAPDELNLLVLPMGWYGRVAELEKDLKLPSGMIEEIRGQVVLLKSAT